MTQIEWTHLPGFKGESWNPIVGCAIVSKGCTNCYAMKQAGRILRMTGGDSHYAGTVTDSKAGPVWTGKVARASETTLTAPLRARDPRCYFVNSMGDLFAEGVPDEWIDQVFAVMALAPEHRFIVLTKRPERMREYLSAGVSPNGKPGNDVFMRITGELLDRTLSDAGIRWHELSDDRHSTALFAKKAWPLPNVWLGVSVEDQASADARIPLLLETPAAIRFISAEPLLGPVDLTWLAQPNEDADGVLDCLRGLNWVCGKRYVAEDGREGAPLVRLDHIDAHGKRGEPRLYVTRENIRPDLQQHWEPASFDPVAKLDWVIAGGESGPDARPMHSVWARSLRDQCAAAGVPFFFKQWGEWAPDWTPEQGRTCSARVVCPDGEVLTGARMVFGRSDVADAEVMLAIGKKAAGHLLDGVEHFNWPDDPAGGAS
ncbi:phage Gp37/Gp68 family protein [Maricaulis maris]|uniref:Phage protein Gp37/Gp68 n=1 Tax=Maricaulis maris TaxID=74318 RepID=A0A495D1L0_9PROT|nr:phage Gp37/Gp68 family protein [Maricaulis maris]RKQ95445.1 phage protein Gp37/Gp68 [Maricaulis maris]